MNRDDVEKILNNEDTLDYGSQSGFECEMISNLIDKIYDDFEKDLKDINNQVSRLKKQLSKDHHIKCSCSFCKPLACSYVDNNFTFTSCDDCKNKIDGTYQEICSNCKRFYGCCFEAKEKLC